MKYTNLFFMLLYLLLIYCPPTPSFPPNASPAHHHYRWQVCLARRNLLTKLRVRRCQSAWYDTQLRIVAVIDDTVRAVKVLTHGDVDRAVGAGQGHHKARNNSVHDLEVKIVKC